MKRGKSIDKMKIARWTCVIIGIILIAAGAYMASSPKGYDGLGCVALIVECESYDQLSRAIAAKKRLTVAMAFPNLSTNALKAGLEVIVKPVSIDGTVNWEQIAATGARGVLVEQIIDAASLVAGEGYVVSKEGIDGALLPDYILDGSNEVQCANALSALVNDVQNGLRGIALYSWGEEFPLEEVIARLKNVDIVFISKLLQP